MKCNILFCIILLFWNNLYTWDRIGHAAIANVAEMYSHEITNKKIQKILHSCVYATLDKIASLTDKRKSFLEAKDHFYWIKCDNQENCYDIKIKWQDANSFHNLNIGDLLWI